LGDDRNDFLGEELLHNKRCVARCVRTQSLVSLLSAGDCLVHRLRKNSSFSTGNE
jgi:hypothetical protein